MTIEFYKRKKQAKNWAKQVKRFARRDIKVARVRVANVGFLNNAGGRKIGGSGKFKPGEVGYVLAFRGMSEAGLRRARK
jgi:hypothetical protein